MFRFLTAGESHGPQLTAIIDGVPAGIPVSEEWIARDLARRQWGYVHILPIVVPPAYSYAYVGHALDVFCTCTPH